MNPSKLLMAVGLLIAAPVFANSHQSSVSVSPATTTEAEVRKVDRGAKKVTLKHHEIKNLEMPPMTMVFAVKDESMLGRVNVGDKVRFTAEKVGGTFTVTSIDPVE
jgi:Cu(I)/Ag(I) efflux system protein CusF